MIDNGDIAAAREVVDRYAGSGRVLTHSIVHPNLGEPELERMGEWSAQLRPAGWKVYTLWDPPEGPTGGWFLDDETGEAFLDRVSELGPTDRVRAQGAGRADPVERAGRGLTPRHRSRRSRPTPTSTSSSTTPGYDIDATSEEGAHDRRPATRA